MTFATGIDILLERLGNIRRNYEKYNDPIFCNRGIREGMVKMYGLMYHDALKCGLKPSHKDYDVVNQWYQDHKEV